VGVNREEGRRGTTGRAGKVQRRLEVERSHKSTGEDVG